MPNPNLLTPQQHRFVIAIMEGKTQVDAYKAARFPTGVGKLKLTNKHCREKAGDMLKEPPVAGALARAQSRAIDLAAVTTASLVADLQEARDIAFACDPPQVSAAVAATMGIGKLLGLVIDRSKVDLMLHKPAISSSQLELSEDEWKRQFDPQVETARGAKRGA